METVTACNCCGNKRLRLAYRQPDALYHPDRWFDVLECEECGLGFVSPRPTLDELDEYYPQTFYDSFEDESAHRRRYERQASFLVSPKEAGRPLRLLDVGCARGHFPRYMRARGWEVEGVEIGANAQIDYDFPVYRTTLDRVDLPDARFDAITAWAVLEHVHDPKSYFETAARLLKPGGQLVFLVTNFESLSSRALFREDIPRHLHLFTESCVSRYLADASLEYKGKVADNGIYEMKPANVLYYLAKRLSGKRLDWEDLPESRQAYLTKRKLPPTQLNSLRFFMARPSLLLDRLAATAYERIQIMRGTYGIVTYSAMKPESST